MLWRVRLVTATASVGWFLMGDAPAFLTALLGAAALAVALIAASVLADAETRVVRFRRMERRK